MSAFILTESATATQLMEKLIPTGSNIIYQNQVINGNPACAALFTGGQSVVTDTLVGFPDTGIVLSSGNATTLYNQDGINTGTSYGTPGGIDIAQGSGDPFDECSLEYLFKCDNTDNGGQVVMDYNFGSDEYNIEGWPYRDTFALLLNGVNIATLPGSNDVVSIENISPWNNTDYFVDNRNEQFPLIEPDGFSTRLTATGPILNSNQWNTMKIGVVDVLDSTWDSWVFMDVGEFVCNPAGTTVCAGSACGGKQHSDCTRTPGKTQFHYSVYQHYNSLT